MKYCQKDGDFIEIGDIDLAQEKHAREGKTAILGKRLCSGENLVDIIEEHPELVFKFKQIEANVQAYMERKARNKPTCEDYIPNTWNIELPLLEDKKKHYWIWSTAPNLGKTTFLRKLDTDFRCSWYNINENF